MASIKIKFRHSIVPENEGTIYYQIICNRKTRQINTSFKIFPFEWNEQKNKIIVLRQSERKDYLQSIIERVQWETELLNKIIADKSLKQIYFTTDDIVDEFLQQKQSHSLFNFMSDIIARLKRLGKIRTSENYATTFNSFRSFRNGKDIMLDNIDSDIMQQYEVYLSNRGVKLNSISFYMRILRATYNRAVEKGMIEQRQPFRHVYTGIAKTVKRALPLNAIKRIKNLDLASKQHLALARDIFMFSFYTRGMSFIDIAFLKKTDLQNGILSYCRRKTGQLLHIRWERCMQHIIDLNPTDSNSPFLLPIIRSTIKDERRQYQCAMYKINQALKEIAQLVGLDINLTLYVARHSWASVARSKNIPISVISEGMGHDNETTTQIYLASLDTSAINRANSQILNSLD